MPRPVSAIAATGASVLALLAAAPAHGGGPPPSFTSATYPVGAAPAGVASGDFNGDGRPDLAVANTADGTVSQLLGGPAGVFSAGAVRAIAGATPAGPVAGDLNGDGHADLVVPAGGAGGAGHYAVLLGGPDGLGPATDHADPGLLAVGSVALAQLTGSPALDLVTAGSGSSLHVAAGRGDGTFDAAGVVPVPFSVACTGGLGGLSAGPIDEDAHDDVLAMCLTPVRARVMRGDGAGGLTAGAQLVSGLPALAQHSALGDLDGAPPTDLATDAGAGAFGALDQSPGTGLFAPLSGPPTASPIPLSGAGTLGGVAIGDVNGDGRGDVLLDQSGAAGELVTALGDGTGGFEPRGVAKLTAAASHAGGGLGAGGIVAADLDGDGRLDAAIVNTLSGDVSVLRNSTAALPQAFTAAATDVSTAGATLTGSTNAGGQPTTTRFEYGPASGGDLIATPASAASSASAYESASAHVGGLAPATTYRFRVLAENPAAGTRTGGRFATFTTSETPPPPPPPLTDVPVAAPTQSASTPGAFPAAPSVRDGTLRLRLRTVRVGSLTCQPSATSCDADVSLYARVGALASAAAGRPRLTRLSRRTVRVAQGRAALLTFPLGPRALAQLRRGRPLPVLVVVHVRGRADWVTQRIVLRGARR